ncbi:hypothetical protein FSARC_5339 [Fusarium sarcochroum]|uniref:Carrier domain-containing protein n=1 Tax=Fusarium sarcochroum TaxID=1208366 RepID=A0A8H4TZM6_9HYPO|nr:hypothetical protein FSARC_5339 [Fusarium sarcochroum]
MESREIMSRKDVDEKTLDEIATACNLRLEQIDDVYACTPLQMATMAESTLHPGASVFQFVLDLFSTIDLDRFCTSLQNVVSLNAVLRTRLVECRQGLVQVVTTEQYHTRRLPSDVDIKDYMIEDEKEPLGLSTPLFRTAIGGSKMLLTMHHGIMDHASLTPLFQDVLSVYHGDEANKRAEFKEFVAHCLQIDDNEAKTFWSSRFTGAPAIFPKVSPRYVPFSTHTISRNIVLDRVGKEVSAAHVPSYIEVAWALTASSYTSSDSVAFGLILSGRISACAAAETTLGPTIAIVPVQVNLQKSTTLEMILKDRTSARRQLQQHPALQYGVPRIRGVSESARVACEFQTLLNIRPRWYDPKESSEVSYDDMKEPAEPFALSISCDLEDYGITVQASADATVIPEEQLARVLDQFEHMLRSLTEATLDTKLDQIPKLSPGNLSEIMKWNSTFPEPEEKCIHELFRAQARQRPESVAVEAWDGNLTYAELDDMSDRLARELRTKGVVSGSLIAFVFEKSLWTVVAVIGIIKAGAASVPISADDPPARKKQVISNAGIKVIVTSSAEYENCVGLAPGVLEISASTISAMSSDSVSPDDDYARDPSALAFVIYTSGSTGLPKGVMLEHRNLASAFKQLIQRLRYEPGCRTLQFAAHVWDVHLGETFTCLLSGGCIVIPSEDDRKSRLGPVINSSRIDYLWLTPTVIRTLSPEEIPGVKVLLSVGEAIAPDAASLWGGSLHLFNGWGPCESSLASAVADVAPDSPYPESIGYPFNSLLWIVNPRNVDELVPIGTVGEILIDGPGVGRGYLNDVSKTKTAFIRPPAWASSVNNGSKERRLYRTGDLARYNPDGSLNFIGRRDNQVKIRGQRLELGELENNLSSSSEIRDILTTTKIVDGRTHLVAIVTLVDARLPSKKVLEVIPDKFKETVTNHLRVIGDYARSNLPSYMIPTIWLVVQQMPRTESAKLDRTAVTQWLKDKGRLSSAKLATDIASSEAITAPRTDEEQLLQTVWATVLNLPKDSIGRESCFVSLGGDSILAMQAASRCLRQKVAVTTAELLRNTPLSVLAEAAASKARSKGVDAVDGKPGVNSRKLPISEALLGHLGSLGIDRRNVEAVVPATDGQATMLAVGEIGHKRGYHIDFELQCSPSLDTARLRNACEQVAKHHGILRTVFVKQNTDLYQIVLKDTPPNLVVDETAKDRVISFSQGAVLACFHLASDRQGDCQSLRLEIHHALYDAISLGLIFRDLNAAYTGMSLSEGLEFHDWASHVESLDASTSRKFWQNALKGSTMSSMISGPKGAIRGYALDKQVERCVPLNSLAGIPSATPSSLVKTAWALLLSQALSIEDVVFGEVSANRYLSLPGIEGVRGPCVNQVPVRTRLDASMTVASLVSQIQELHTAGLPHHHLGTRSIIKECTAWPHWTRFSTALVYQNHASVSDVVKIGDSNYLLSIHGELGDSTDIHVIATPHENKNELEVALRYSALTFAPKQIQWIAEALTRLLKILPSSLEQSVGEMQKYLASELGSTYVVHAGPKTKVASGEALEHILNPTIPPSEKAQEVVTKVWELAGLLLEKGPDTKRDASMWDLGADIVTILLLSEEYRSQGYDISPNDIVENPNRDSQVALVDGRSPETSKSTPVRQKVVQSNANSAESHLEAAKQAFMVKA